MSTAFRQQRRCLDRFAAGVDHITAEDRRWFEERPERRFRLRRMTAAEIGTAEAIGALRQQPSGAARFTLIRKVTPDMRIRIFVFGPASRSGEDASDNLAETLWLEHLRRSSSAQRAESIVAAALRVEDTEHPGGAA